MNECKSVLAYAVYDMLLINVRNTQRVQAECPGTIYSVNRHVRRLQRADLRVQSYIDRAFLSYFAIDAMRQRFVAFSPL